MIQIVRNPEPQNLPSVYDFTQVAEQQSRALLRNRATHEVIGEWKKDGAIWRPVGTLDLDRHPDTQHGIVASGSGTSYVVNAGHTLPASGVLRPWDVSAAAKAAPGDVGFTRVGTVVTFASARALVAGDPLYYLPDGKRTGPFDIDEAGDVVPLSGTFVFAGGPKVTNGIALIYGVINPRGGDELPSVEIDCNTSAPTNGMAIGLGLLRTADLAEHHAGGVGRIAGAYRIFGRRGPVMAPLGTTPEAGDIGLPSRLHHLLQYVGGARYPQWTSYPIVRREYWNFVLEPAALALILIAEPGGAETVSIRVKTIANL